MKAQSEIIFFLSTVDFSVLLLLYIKLPSSIRPTPCLSWIVILNGNWIQYIPTKPVQEAADILGSLSSATHVSCQLSLLELSLISSANWAAEQDLQTHQTKPHTMTDTLEQICFKWGDGDKLWKVNINPKMVVHSAVEIDCACWQLLSDKERQILHRVFLRVQCIAFKLQFYPFRLALNLLIPQTFLKRF